MSADDTGNSNSGGQALLVDDAGDESNVPTAPMRAVPAQAAPQRRPFDFEDEDDDDEGPVGSRPGSTGNPFTETPHAEIPLPAAAQIRVDAARANQKPSVAKALALALVWIVLLAGVIFGVAKAAGLMG